MADAQNMITAALNAMKHVMSLTKEDRVLVVTDNPTRSIGDAFHQAAAGYGCVAELYIIPDKQRPLSEVPPEMIGALKDKNFVINALKGLKEETPFRVKWIKVITDSKTIRLGHSPNITESMMTKGPMNVDYQEMLNSAKQLMKGFADAKTVHITAPSGTDIVLGIEDRAFKTDVEITEENAGNLPCGEIWCGPIENKAEGLLVIDGSIGDIGNVAQLLKISMQGGKITKLESEDQNLVEEVNSLTSIDEEAAIIGELGIGLNPGAKLTGNLLEDEKALHTAHIAFGNNEDMPGGNNRSQTHRDFLFYKPTFDITFKDGSLKTLIKDGEFQF